MEKDLVKAIAASNPADINVCRDSSTLDQAGTRESVLCFSALPEVAGLFDGAHLPLVVTIELYTVTTH